MSLYEMLLVVYPPLPRPLGPLLTLKCQSVLDERGLWERGLSRRRL